jgi:hypothetical protein
VRHFDTMSASNMKINIASVTMIAFSIMFASQVRAQEYSISGAGGIHENNRMMVAWNLGDCVMEGFAGEHYQLTHGLVTAMLLPLPPPARDHALDFQVYPNPFEAGLTVRLSKEPELPLIAVLIDIKGKILDEQTISRSNQELYWHNLLKGMYLLQLYDQEGNIHHVRKVVKY